MKPASHTSLIHAFQISKWENLFNQFNQALVIKAKRFANQISSTALVYFQDKETGTSILLLLS